MAAFHVVIPARFASQRLPGKPLLPIAGRPMIQRVYEQAMRSGAVDVVIATDDARIAAAAEGFGGRVCMTSPDHTSGTDRIAEVVQDLGWPDEALVVNLQGDEPMMPPALLCQVAEVLQSHPQADMATLSVPLDDSAQLFDTNVVKVVSDRQGHALYFSRATIPWKRDLFDPSAAVSAGWLDGVYRHLGIYAYRVGFLKGYSRLEPAPIERMESLEQLRVLWHGGRIAVGVASEMPPAGVDTTEDLARVEAALAGAPSLQ
jgi:3-deoxy-manno-octulosonate cytidylyltransferase (CMP-KDO synthetase)